MTEQRCGAARKDGTPCNAAVVGASGFCFAHDPAREEERKAARVAGGRARKRVVAKDDGGLPPELRDPNTAIKAMWQALLDVRAGRLDVKAANSIAILGGNILKGLEVADMADRLASLEELVAEDEAQAREDATMEPRNRREWR